MAECLEIIITKHQTKQLLNMHRNVKKQQNYFNKVKYSVYPKYHIRKSLISISKIQCILIERKHPNLAVLY